MGFGVLGSWGFGAAPCSEAAWLQGRAGTPQVIQVVLHACSRPPSPARCIAARSGLHLALSRKTHLIVNAYFSQVSTYAHLGAPRAVFCSKLPASQHQCNHGSLLSGCLAWLSRVLGHARRRCIPSYILVSLAEGVIEEGVPGYTDSWGLGTL